MTDLSKLDELDLLCTTYVCFHGDLAKMQAWFEKMGYPKLAKAAKAQYKDLNSFYHEVRRRVLERKAVQALCEVMADPKSRQKVNAASQLLILANADTSTAEGRAMLVELQQAGNKSAKRSRS